MGSGEIYRINGIVVESVSEIRRKPKAVFIRECASRIRLSIYCPDKTDTAVFPVQAADYVAAPTQGQQWWYQSRCSTRGAHFVSGGKMLDCFTRFSKCTRYPVGAVNP